MKRTKAIITIVLIMAGTLIIQGFQIPPGEGKSLISKAISESAEEREETEMAKTTDRQVVNGETYLIMDASAREMISAEVTAREAEVSVLQNGLNYGGQSIPSHVAGEITNAWTNSAPQLGNQYYPITLIKGAFFIGVHFKAYFNQACTFTVRLRTIADATPLAPDYVIEIPSAGDYEIFAYLPAGLDAGEYRIQMWASTGWFGYSAKNSQQPYIDDGNVANYGGSPSSYIYDNTNVVFQGEILYAMGDWRNALEEQLKKDGVSLELVKAENPEVRVPGTYGGSQRGSWTRTDDATFVCNRDATSGNSWFEYQIDKTKLENNFLVFDFDLETQDNSKLMPWVFGKKATDGTTLYMSGPDCSAGHCHVEFDLNYYVVYNDLDLTEPITAGLGNSGNPCHVNVKNFKIITPKYVFDTSIPFYKTVNQMYSDIESNKNAITVLDADKYITSPDGSKFMLAVANDGTLSAIPTIPNKTLFIGNSLLIGNGDFGMCASAEDKDYYHYVTQAILERKPTATFDKISGGTFEGSTSVAAAQTWMEETLLPHLGNDVNLVIIQLGDNVNTADKERTFAVTCGQLIQYIKEHAPAARVAWAAMWYANNYKMQVVSEACAGKGAVFIDITTVHRAGSESYIGAVIDYGTTQARSYTVDSFTDDQSNQELTVLFTVNGTQYTSVVPYESYTSSGSTLTITGTYGFVTQGGVASHPGDAGFEAIGNLMIEKLGLN